MSGKFPDGFLWGAAMSAYQVEGGIENNDWAEVARQGKAPAAGIACDHYRRYEEDFDIAKSLNHNAHRFSIEWARIEPEEGKFDQKEIEHYRSVIRALRARGIEPFVTLWHFTSPLWFAEKGSWASPEASNRFGRYVAYVVEQLGSEIKFFVTINEPTIWIGEHALTLGVRPPLWRNPFKAVSIFLNFISAHKKAYRTIKSKVPAAQVGMANHSFAFEGQGFIGTVAASLADFVDDRLFLNLTAGHHDFIGLQYYLPIRFWQSKKQSATALRSDIGWEIYPSGIYGRIKELARYRLPIYITENGIADAKDEHREKFIKDSLTAVLRAIAEGAPVKGYLHWSLMDNFESITLSRGFTMRFGLVAIDFDHDLTRTIRPSAQAYAEIIKNNGL